MEEEGPGWLERLERLARGAEVLVSAGPYNPGRAAVLTAGQLPVWADLPGDPFAELQAAVLAGEAEVAGARAAATRAAALAVLGRADAISTISEAQRAAVLGQLGLLGRLEGEPWRERAFSVPVAWGFAPRIAPRVRGPEEPLVVALAGSFNTWLDDQTLARGLERALAGSGRVRVIVAGGAVEGHASRGWARFQAWAETRRDRVSLLGWAPEARVHEALAGAHLGLCLDRPSHEPALGSRTRLLLFAQLGLLGVATPLSPLARELEALGALVAVPPADPEALAEVILEEARAPRDRGPLAHAQEILAARHDPDRLAAPLLAWVADPVRLAPSASPERLLAEENARLKAELAAVHGSPTWRALARVHAAIGGRGPTR